MFWQRVTYEFHEISITYMSQQNVEVTEGSPALKKQKSHNICRDLSSTTAPVNLRGF